MAKKYTREDILRMVREASEDMTVFYRQDFVNYRGTTSDTGEYYTEIIAEWCCQNIDLFKKILPISRESSYWMETHDGVPDHPHTNREEELIAMAMFRQGEISGLGKVLDYQTPLKNKRTDRAGKIDLLAYDGETLRILELKEPDSEETMLRCILEGDTYLRTVDKMKLLADFSLPKETAVTASPFVFYRMAQYKEMQQERPHLKHLMELLQCKPYYIQEANGLYIVREV